MKYQLSDNPSACTMTECSKQILAQLLGAIAFSGSTAGGLVTFQWLSHYPGLESSSMMLLFSLSLMGAAIAFITVSLFVWSVIASVKFTQGHFHYKRAKTWAH